MQDREYVLNPFETLAIKYLKGEVLDLSSRLGNLSLEAGRRDHRVVAVDASPIAVDRINADARREGLPVEALQVDLENWSIDRTAGARQYFPCSSRTIRPRSIKA